jgi:hypothetical protein
MRNIVEIKADIEKTQICDYPICTPCEPEWLHAGTRCAHCNAIYSANLPDVERELIITLATGIPLDRLEAICNAEHYGRCEVLPCKAGDTWYNIYDGKINEIIIDKICVGQINVIHFSDKLYPGATFNVPEWRFNEICKSTRPEAEDALERKEHGDE